MGVAGFILDGPFKDVTHRFQRSERAFNLKTRHLDTATPPPHIDCPKTARLILRKHVAFNMHAEMLIAQQDMAPPQVTQNDVFFIPENNVLEAIEQLKDHLSTADHRLLAQVRNVTPWHSVKRLIDQIVP